jgi:hypothetical protein
MKKIAILMVALALAGCAQLQAISTGITLATKTIANPVTKADEAKAELVGDTAVQALLTYKRACMAGTADKNCRINIAQIQAYTRQIPPLVAQLRTFVDNNDQINASVIFNQLTALYDNVKNTATSLGIPLGASA